MNNKHLACQYTKSAYLTKKVHRLSKKKPLVGTKDLKWSERRGSNSRHPPWQGGALPTELRPQIQFF